MDVLDSLLWKAFAIVAGAAVCWLIDVGNEIRKRKWHRRLRHGARND